jgi:Zn-dependent peptidase ImmA (M78 family)/transcriptional regulator with XRE-family HTH domain
MPSVSKAILVWARETAGLSLEDAARAIGLKDSQHQSATEKLVAMESGREEPSRPQLLRIAKAYKRPLLLFYLERPPGIAAKGEDFRTLPLERAHESAAEIEHLLRDVHVRQQLVRSTLEDADETGARGFVGTVHANQSVMDVASVLRDRLQFDLSRFRAFRSIEESFAYLRQRVEATGVFVMLAGNLGSHHSNISPDVFRGFALADEMAPFVVVNDQDAKSAWSFTLLHELAHVWLGRTGISGGLLETGIEQFCNRVASELLLPSSEFASWAGGFEVTDDLVGQISAYAAPRKVSRALVNYRLLLSGAIDRSQWQVTSKLLREIWLEERAQAKAQREGAPSYYIVRRHRVGDALLQVVRRGLQEGILTPTKAGKVLGVKPANVEPMLAAA